MSHSSPSFTLGIEEEYLLVDLQSRHLANDPPEELFDRCKATLGEHVTHEFLRAQLEVGTGVCQDINQARIELHQLRSEVARITEQFDLGIIAASTHPFSFWSDQQHTAQPRYDLLAEDLQGVVRRLATCGMHVHVGIDDPELRIDLMNQAVYFLPHLLALSTSSPFWGGDDTGLKSYRLAVFNELPRTGLPDKFSSNAEYLRHVRVLTQSGLINDASMLWWDLRPSCRYPTLEMRITDVCTRIEDALTIAALFQSTLAMLYQLRRRNQRWRQYSPMLVQENRWRAQRYGTDEGMIDFGQQSKLPFADLMEEWLELLHKEAKHLNCLQEVSAARDIIARGTSADEQRRRYQRAVAGGEDPQQALVNVVDWLLEETRRGLQQPTRPL